MAGRRLPGGGRLPEFMYIARCQVIGKVSGKVPGAHPGYVAGRAGGKVICGCGTASTGLDVLQVCGLMHMSSDSQRMLVGGTQRFNKYCV